MRQLLRIMALIATSSRLLAAAPVPARAGAVFLDPFTEPFPPNPCITDFESRVIFCGQYCATTCPPDTLRTNWCGAPPSINWAMPALPLYPAGTVSRMEWVDGNTLDDGVTRAEVLPAEGRIEAYNSHPSGAQLWLVYNPAYEWTADFAAIGATGLRIPLSGDLSPAQPLTVVVTFPGIGPDGAGVTCTAHATAAGDLVLPFTAFTPAGGPAAYDLRHVGSVWFTFEDCDTGNCHEPMPPRHYSIGGIRVDTDASTAAPRRTWGQLKAAYR